MINEILISKRKLIIIIEKKTLKRKYKYNTTFFQFKSDIIFNTTLIDD